MKDYRASLARGCGPFHILHQSRGLCSSAFQDARAKVINDQMKIAAARGIASIISKSELSEDYIIPSVFDRRVVEVVASEVVKAAYETGVARRSRVEKKRIV